MNTSAALQHTLRLQNLPKHKITCIALEAERLLRLQSCAQTLTVTAGCAYLTWNGNDYLLRVGQQMHLPQSRFPALVSAAGEQMLHFEIITQA